MSPRRRSRLSSLLAEATLADRDVEKERARAQRDSANFSQGMSVLRGLVPQVADVATGVMKRDEDKAEKLRLEGREDAQLIAKATGAERIAKIKADAVSAKAKAKVAAQDAANEIEVPNDEADQANRSMTMSRAIGKVRSDVDAENVDDGAREQRMGDALERVDTSFNAGTSLSKGASAEEKAREARVKTLMGMAKDPKSRPLITPEGWAMIEDAGLAPPKASTSNEPKVTAKEQRAIDAVNERKKNTAQRGADSLRKEYNALPEVKAFNEVSIAVEKMKAAAKDPSPAGDITLLFAVMKANDPTSTVRESEFATAARAGDLGDKIQAQVESVVSGKRLTNDQRQDFLRQAQNFYGAHKQAADAARARYDDIARRRGADAADVTGATGQPATNDKATRRRARIGELRAGGLSKEQARAILAQEGLL